MGKVFCLMGKSASGKDTVYKELLKRLPLSRVVPYTTRPKRMTEINGVEYHFVTDEKFHQMQAQGIVIEFRIYHTIHGSWTYYTADDGQIDIHTGQSYLIIGTLETYREIRRYFGEDIVIPLYLELDPKERLCRAIERESQQTTPDYQEVCRRFLADEEDFSEEKLQDCGVNQRFVNDDFEKCIKELSQQICILDASSSI
jgi:guanylate kinase